MKAIKFYIAKITMLLFLVAIIIGGIACGTYESNSYKSFPQRIISLSPNVTEALYALHAEEKIIAVTDFCSFPPQAKKKQRIGGLLNPNIEKIIALKPDVLIGTPAHAELANKLDGYNLKTVLLANDSLEDVFTAIDSIGMITGFPERADSLNKLIRDSLIYYNNLSAGFGSLSAQAMFVLGREAGSTRNISVIGPGTFTDQLWRMAGGKNVFAKLPQKFAQVSRESLIHLNPELIIEFKFNTDLNESQKEQLRREWQELKQLRAVINDNIFFLTGDHTLIPGPRIYLLSRDYYFIIKRYSERGR